MIFTPRLILIAEDNNNHYINFVQAINGISKSVEVMRVENGYDLFSMLQTNIQPDIIFLDIDMPYKSGLQILEEIKGYERFNNTPIVVLSSSAQEVVIRTAYMLGAIFFVKKYLRPAELKAALETILQAPNLASCIQPAWAGFLVE